LKAMRLLRPSPYLPSAERTPSMCREDTEHVQRGHRACAERTPPICSTDDKSCAERTLSARKPSLADSQSV
jgi:hypothetical protein